MEYLQQDLVQALIISEIPLKLLTLFRHMQEDFILSLENIWFLIQISIWLIKFHAVYGFML